MARKQRRSADSPTPPDPPPGWSISPRLAVIVLVLLSSAALAARVVPTWSQVFPGQGLVRLLGGDPYFHVRQARSIAHHFPHLHRWDVGTHYPEGQWSDAVGLYDLAIGGAAWLIGAGEPTNGLVDRVAAWTPPLLAALSIWLLYLLARTVLDRWAALLAAAVFLLYPGSSLQRSLLGFADHHVAEIVLVLLTAWGLTRCLQGRAPPPTAPWWRPALAHASPLAVLVFTWVGAPIYLLFVFLTLFVVATVEIAHGASATTAARSGSRYGGALLLLVGVPSALWPDLVMSPGLLRPVLFGCVAVAVVPAVHVYAARLLLRRLERPRLVALLGAVAVVVLAVLFVGFVPKAQQFATLLLAPKGMTLVEHRTVDWHLYFGLLGVPGIVALAALPLGLWRAFRRPVDRFCLVPILFGVLVLGLWLTTRDYDYAPPAFVALMTVFVTVEVANRVRRPDIAWMRWAGPLALAAVLLLPVWPLQLVQRPLASKRLSAAHQLVTPAWEQAMDWMRQHTPEPSLPIDARVAPFAGKAGYHYPPGTYGVLTAWDFGNLVNVLGARVPVWSRWPAARTASWMVCEDEQESLALLCPTCEEGEEVRYVVLDARTTAQHFPGKILLAGRRLEDYATRTESWYPLEEGGRIPHRTYGPRYERSMSVRLYRDDAQRLGHYRLVYESSRESYIRYVLWPGTYVMKRVAHDIESEAQRLFLLARTRTLVTRVAGHYEYDGVVTPAVKIFEVVPGARLTGTARAGTEVEARLALRCGSRGREVEYVRAAVAGASDRFEIVVAHPTGPAAEAATCEATGPYVLHTRSEADAVELGSASVSLQQVRAGARVDMLGAAQH